MMAHVPSECISNKESSFVSTTAAQSDAPNTCVEAMPQNYFLRAVLYVGAIAMFLYRSKVHVGMFPVLGICLTDITQANAPGSKGESTGRCSTWKPTVQGRYLSGDSGFVGISDVERSSMDSASKNEVVQSFQ